MSRPIYAVAAINLEIILNRFLNYDPLGLLYVLAPFSEQAHVFTIEGHQWPLEPGRAGTDLLDSAPARGLETLTIQLEHGAGGRAGNPGDYIFGVHREPYQQAGLWGQSRVYPPAQEATGLLPLPGR